MRRNIFNISSEHVRCLTLFLSPLSACLLLFIRAYFDNMESNWRHKT